MSCLGNKHESTVLAQALATAAAAARGEVTEEPSFFRLMSRLPIFDDDGEDISRSMWVEDFVILRSRYCNFKAHTRNSTLYVVLHRRAGKKKKTLLLLGGDGGGTVEALRPAPIWQPKMSPFPNALSLASSFEVSPAQAIVCSTFFLSDCVASGHDSSLLRFAPRRHVVTQELE